jgi:tetratricopeptide (TPR) repeat protein
VAVVALLALSIAACAAKTPPALPSALKYPDFVYPTVPQALASTPAADAIDRAWRYLQNDNAGAADRELSAALKRNRMFYPALAGQGWVEMARHNYDRALTDFDAALSADRRYVPALIGRAQSLLALKRNADALTAFESALAVDPSLADVRRRVEVLRFRTVQEIIERARAAARGGRLDDAKTAYDQAIAASPDSAFLYRELAMLERKRGDDTAALGHFRKAVELDPSDAASWTEVGMLLENRQDFEGAVNAYRRAVAIESTPELTARLAAATEKARDASLPAEYRAIAQSPQVTRGELAALIGVRLEPLLRGVKPRQVVVTDIRGHWAAPWIATVLGAGVMDAFDNHTFQPRQRVRRVDLAAAVSRVLGLLAPRLPELRAKMSGRPAIADISANHLSYPAVSAAVAAGVMPLADGQRFQLTRPVSGMEAIDTIERLRALASSVR